MRFGSVCSGIEAASVAWQPLGWKAQWLSEIEPFPCALLAHHYPNTPNLGDMTKFESWPTDDQHAIDLLCGGTPCQSFSVAGLRKGLDDPRGNLMLTFGAIAAKYRPQWLVWENVPGVLSSNGGRDFGAFLGLLGILGYGFAYRVLDAQYFGVAQRRRRVFVVGCLGDWRRAAAVLFERHSLSGHPAPRRQAGKVAPTIPARSLGGGGLGTDFDCDGGLISSPHAAISPALKARDGKGPSSDGDGDGDGAILVPMLSHATTQFGEMAGTLTARHDSSPCADRGMNVVAQAVGVTIHGTDPTVQKVASYSDVAQCLRARTPGNIDNSSTTVVQQLVTYALQGNMIGRHNLAGPAGSGISAELCFTQTKMDVHAVVTPMVPVTVGTLSCNTGPRGHDAGNFACNQAVDAGHVLPVAIRTAQTGSNGCGINEDGVAYTLDSAQGQAVAFVQNSRDEVRLMGGDGSIVGALAAEPGMKQTCYIAQPVPFRDTTDCLTSAYGTKWNGNASADNGSLFVAQPAVAVSLRGREGGATAELGDEVGNCLRASGGGGDKAHVLAAAHFIHANKGRPDGRQSSHTEMVSIKPLVETLTTDGHAQSAVFTPTMQVRRLTPRECERLQGFPDDYTLVPNRGKPAADGPRYKALGNSWAVPNVRWIGERIAAVAAIKEVA